MTIFTHVLLGGYISGSIRWSSALPESRVHHDVTHVISVNTALGHVQARRRRRRACS